MARSSDTEDGGLTQEQHVLPDLLKTGMVTVLCGEAVAKGSAKKREYYADPRNNFWNILCDTGLTPRKFDPGEYPELAKLHIGLTDLNKIGLSGDPESSYDVNGLYQKIEEFCPRILAFAGKEPAQIFLKAKFGVKKKDVDYGLQPKRFPGGTELFVLPSTSSRNVRWHPELLGSEYCEYWLELADLHQELLAEE